MKRILVFLMATVMAAMVTAPSVPEAEAASTLTSIEFSNFVVYNNGCMLGQSVYQAWVVVHGVSDSTQFTVVEHFGALTSAGLRPDSNLSQVLDLGATFNNTGWTGPGDTPQVYVEAMAGGVTVRTPTIEIDCATGTYRELGASPTAITTADCGLGMPISSTSVVGKFVATTETYWAPGKLTSPSLTLPAGQSAWVLGIDESGQYYQIVWACDLLWVPVANMGPNCDEVWHGAPLPTIVRG